MPNETGANTFSYDELERLFSNDEQQESPTATETQEPTPDTQSESTNNVETTKAFAKRLSEKTE